MTTVSVPSTGPYGVVIEADRFGHAAVVKSWSRLPSGKFGPIQKHGGVNIGDVLVSINDINVTDTSFMETNELLSKSMSSKVLKFVNSSEYYNKKKGAGKGNAFASKETNKAPFLSVIKKARVNNFASTNFVEYEIMCQLRVASLSVDKEKTFRWSVWRRFSDFEQLNTALKKTLGWHMDSISFPSSHTFVLNKFAPDFIEQRREELNEYWQKIISIDKVTEFNKHHCSAALKKFIDVEGALLGEKDKEKPLQSEEDSEAPASSKESSEDEKSKKSEGSGNQSRRPSSRRLSSRASSTKGSMRRGSSAKSVNASSSSVEDKDEGNNTSNASVDASPVSTPVSSPPATTQAPPKATSPKPPAESTSTTKPPPPSAARANLLGSINALRKD